MHVSVFIIPDKMKNRFGKLVTHTLNYHSNKCQSEQPTPPFWQNIIVYFGYHLRPTPFIRFAAYLVDIVTDSGPFSCCLSWKFNIDCLFNESGTGDKIIGMWQHLTLIGIIRSAYFGTLEWNKFNSWRYLGHRDFVGMGVGARLYR